MDHDLLRRHEDFLRDNQLRRELDAAAPSIGPAGLIITAAIVIILAVVYFGPSLSNTTYVASRDAMEAPAPILPPTNP
jgi:hypothetical protein